MAYQDVKLKGDLKVMAYPKIFGMKEKKKRKRKIEIGVQIEEGSNITMNSM